jgi:hypothetical protein
MVNSIQTLVEINNDNGLLWEKIERFTDFLKSQDDSIIHHTEKMEKVFPLKHHIEDGLYTRELFMPKGMIVVSFIHKQNHPSFFMKGELSIISEKGDISRIQAPKVVQTKIGTQRIAYTHTDCVWVCVYKVNSKTVEEAEKEVYTEDFRMLPELLIKELELCQE